MTFEVTEERPPTRVGHHQHDPCDEYVGRVQNDEKEGGKAHLLNTEIGEPGWLGNPFRVSEHGRVQCIERFRTEFEARLDEEPAFRAAVARQAGKILGCHCQRLVDDGPACHAEVIAEWADRLAAEADADAAHGEEREHSAPINQPGQVDLRGNPVGQATFDTGDSS